jgi:hypothetical protein
MLNPGYEGFFDPEVPKGTIRRTVPISVCWTVKGMSRINAVFGLPPHCVSGTEPDVNRFTDYTRTSPAL